METFPRCRYPVISRSMDSEKPAVGDLKILVESGHGSNMGQQLITNGSSFFVFGDLGLSENRGYPQIAILMGKMVIIHWNMRYTIFRQTHMIGH